MWEDIENLEYFPKIMKISSCNLNIQYVARYEAIYVVGCPAENVARNMTRT